MTTDTITKDRVFIIDYGMSLEDMIAAGNYDWTNDAITPRKFQLQGEGIVHYQAKIFHFNRYVYPEDAVKAIKADDRHNPWEPAKIEHLLAYAAKNPEGQRNYPIISLGSAAEVGGFRYVPYRIGSGAKRFIGLDWWDGAWDSSYRILAARNLSSAA